MDCDSTFYSSSHNSNSEINLYKMLVKSSMLYSEADDAVLQFADSDSVNMSHFTVDYAYDLNECGDGYSQWSGDSQSYRIGSLCCGYVWQRTCPNPVTLIYNEGEVTMSNIRINLIINNNSAQINATANDLGFSFDDDGDVGFIDNYGVMTVSNMTMDNSLGYYMFYNEGK